VIAGDSTPFSSTVHFAISRYHTDGSLDNTFSGDGKLSNDFGNFSIKTQDDGKIIVTNFSGKSFSSFRYNSDGSMDNSYNANRNYTTDFEIFKISIQSNGEIVAAGTADGNLAIAKYNTARSPDNAFDNDGKLYDSLVYSRSYYIKIAVQSNGKFAGVGSSWVDGKSYIVQYNADGSIDKTFSEDGIQPINYSIDKNSLSAFYQTDGKLVLAGREIRYSNRAFIVRYNTNGSQDSTFNKKGKQEIDFVIASAAIQSDGKIVVAGNKGNYPDSKFALARFNTNGTPDSSFSGGKIVTDFSKGDDFAKTVAIQSDGKIVVAGSTGQINVNQNFAIARYNQDGSLDKTFSGDGKQNSHFDSSSYVNFINSIAIQSDGKIVAAGSVVACYNTDGSLDSTFSVSGQENSIYGYSFRAVAIQNDNKIIVLEDAYSIFRLIRYKANGSLDTAFGVNGRISTSLGELNDMTVVNNKLFAVGSTGDYYFAGSGVAARFLLDNENKAPTVNLTIPHNIVKYTAPAKIMLHVTANDEDGTITKVQFYNGLPYYILKMFIPMVSYG